MVMMYCAKEEREKAVSKMAGSWAKSAAIVFFAVVVAFGLALATAANSYAQTVEPDGSIDPTFKSPYGTTGTPANGAVIQLILQKDNKILSLSAESYFVWHCWHYMDCDLFTQNRYSIIRLNENGSRDNSLASIGFGFTYDPDKNDYFGTEVGDVVAQNDGKILVAGLSSVYPYSSTRKIGGYIQRFNSNGSLDNTFNNTTTTSNNPADFLKINKEIRKIVLQSDGKILVTGAFTNYNGVACKEIIRLNSDGNVDPSFKCNSSSLSDISILLQSDGKILITGWRYSGNNTPIQAIERFNSDGSLDTTFPSQPDIGKPYYRISIGAALLQDDGKIVVRGASWATDTSPAQPFWGRLNSNGALYEALNVPSIDIRNLTAVQNSKFLLASYDKDDKNYLYPRILRLNADANIDPSFNFSIGTSKFNAILQQKDNKIVLGGSFSTTAGYGLVRLDNKPKLNSNISMTSSVNIANYGQRVTLTATVGSAVTGGAAPSGTVYFRLLALGSFPVTLVTGVATYSTDKLPVGSHNITAIYSGDVNYKTNATATGINLIVEKASSSINLTSSANPALVGRTITFTVPRPVDYIGQVIFKFSFADGTSFSTYPTNYDSEAANYVTQTLATGSYTLTASYDGDERYLPSTSSEYIQYITSGCDPLLVTTTNDDGQASTCGTLSYALAQIIDGKIRFNLPAGANTLNISDTLTLRSGFGLDGGTNGIILDGQGRSGDGLRLSGNNTLMNMIIRGFSGRELIIDGKANRLYRVKLES